MTDQKGKLVLYSGSSGVGKGTILKKLMELDAQRETLDSELISLYERWEELNL